MIARNERTQITKRLAKAHQRTDVAKHLAGQKLLYAILWQFIKDVAKDNVEDFDESMDATMTVPKEALEQVPANFALKIGGDADNVSVTATVVKPTSNILLADGSQAPSES